jgi:hypothetical protein
VKAPPRREWPSSGTLVRVIRANGESAGLVKFVAIAGDSLLYSGINRDAVCFLPLVEVKTLEPVSQDGRPANVWG